MDWNLYSAFNIFGSNNDWRGNSFQTAIESQLGFINNHAQIRTWLPASVNFLNQFKSQGVFSFHYYDPWTLFYSFFNHPDNMHNKQREWPGIFKKMQNAAISRGLIPFLTEFGGSHDWEGFYTDLQPKSSLSW